MKHCLSHSSRPAWRLLLAAAVTLAWLGGGSRAVAHPATIAAATAKVQPDGHFEVAARFDILAFVLDDTTLRIGDGPMNALLDGPATALKSQLEDAKARFGRDFQASGGANGPGVIDSVAFPTVADVQAWCNSGVKPRLPVMIPVTVQGHLPPGASSVSFRFPNVLGMVVVTTEFPYREPTSEPVEAGEFSTPLPMTAAPPAPTPTPVPPVAAVRVSPPAPKPSQAVPEPVPTAAVPKPVPTAKGMPAVKPSPTVRDTALVLPFVPPPVAVPSPARLLPAPSVPATPGAVPVARHAPAPPVLNVHPAAPTPAPQAAHALPWIIVVFRYVEMGYRHILPEGPDHILFVLGLFLLSTKLKPLLWQITAFTVAHSLTLALSLYGVLRLPSTIVEPVIAASIAFVAIENLFTTELKPWRPFVVFAFGLVHGMGFAGALLDLGLPRHDFLTALVGFNVGVELGQLSVVALAFVAVGWLRSRPNYRRLVVVPASVAIAAVALFWTVQRVLNVV